MTRFKHRKSKGLAHRRLGFWLLLSSFGALTQPLAWANNSHAKMKAGFVSFVGDATTYYSHQRGFFEDEGISVELSHHNAGVESLRKIVAGELDIGAVAPTPIVHSILGISDIEPNFRIIARISESTNLNHLVVINDAQYPDLQSLKGKRIAITQGTDSEFFWHNLASAYGVEEFDFEFIDMAVPEMAQAAKEGRIDAAVCWSPFHLDVMKAVSGPVRNYGGDTFYTSSWLLVTRPDVLEKHPERVKAYLRALIRAENELVEDPHSIARVHSELVNASASDMVARYEDMYFELSLSESLILNLSLQTDWLLKKSNRQGKAPQLRSYFEPHLLEAIKPGSVTLLE